MQYLLLIYNQESRWEQLTDEERKPIIDEYFALTDSLQDSGNYVFGAPLQPTSTATSVRVKDGQTLVTDGPFAAILIRVLGDFDLAEDAVQDAFAIALARWPRDGLPVNRKFLRV